jgi:hypothetical protein
LKYLQYREIHETPRKPFYMYKENL